MPSSPADHPSAACPPRHPPWLLHARGRRVFGDLCEPQLRRRIEGRAGARPRQPGARDDGARRRCRQARDALSGARHRDDRGRRGVGSRQGAAGGCRRHAPPRHCRRRRCGRLRAGAFRRRARRASWAPPMPAGAARLPAFSNRRSTRWRGSAPSARRIVAVLGPSISQANYEVGPDLVTAFDDGRPGKPALLHRRHRGRGTRCSTSPAYIVGAARGRRRDRGGARPLHLRRPGSASIPIAGRPISASRTTAGCSRQSRSRADADGASFRTRRIRRAAREDAAGDGGARPRCACCSSRRRACTG